MYRYQGKEYCMLHMGQILIKERLKDNHDRIASNPQADAS